MKILINSFDGYSAAWAPLAHSFEKYWPEHPGVIFVTETLNPPIGDTVIKTGPCPCWGDRMAIAIRECPNVVLYMQEDYWLTHPIDHGRIMEIAGYVQDDLADRIQLRAGWGNQDRGSRAPFDSKLIEIARGSAYRSSLQAAIWRKDALRALIHPGDSVWDFERKRNDDTRDMRIYSVGESVIDYPMFIVRGQWRPKAVEYACREGLEIDFNKEPECAA